MIHGKTFFLSFVEECVMDPAYFEYVGGRIEVYETGHDADQYAIEEIRFFTNKQKEFYKLRGKWDFEEFTAKELERLRKKIIVLNEKD